MQEHTRASPRLLAAAAVALVVAAIVAFSWLSGGDVAGAAGTTGGSAPSGQLAPVQSEGYSAPGDARGPRDGRDCPEHRQGGGSSSGSGQSGGGQDSGGSGQPAAPGQSTPSTDL